MKLFVSVLMGIVIGGSVASLTTSLTVSPVEASPRSGSPGRSFSGRVRRVWDDGFELVSGRRSIIVDSYDICGDFAFRFISAGAQLTVRGEFSSGEFDAFSITSANGRSVCNTRFGRRSIIGHGTCDNDEL